MRSYLDFEKPVGELEQKIEELRAMQASGDVSVADEIERLESKAKETLTELYENLTPWQKTQVARWPTRPHCLDYVAQLIADFVGVGHIHMGRRCTRIIADQIKPDRLHSAALSRPVFPTQAGSP